MQKKNIAEGVNLPNPTVLHEGNDTIENTFNLLFRGTVQDYTPPEILASNKYLTILLFTMPYLLYTRMIQRCSDWVWGYLKSRRCARWLDYTVPTAFSSFKFN